MKYSIFLPILALGILGMAPAENSDTKGTTKVRIVEDQMANKEDMGDPSRVICRKQNVTGSRLGSQRVCATAAEWAARKQQSRQSIERAQSQRMTD